MITRSHTTVVAMAAVVSIWSYWLVGKPGRRSTKPISTTQLAALESASAPANFRFTAGEPGLLVYHEDGSPAADAELWGAPPHARFLPPNGATRLAKADAQGRLAWPNSEPDEGTEFLLRVPGHRTATVGRELVGRAIAATVHRSHSLTVHCRTTNGEPVAGAIVTMSGAGWSDTFDQLHELIPGGNPAGALHGIRTGRDGVATVTGLADSNYGLAVEHPTHVACGGTTAIVSIPHDAVNIEMLELVGGVLTPPPGDHVELLAITSDTRVVTKQFSAHGFERLRTRLMTSHPGAGVIVLPPRQPGQPQMVSGTLLLRRRGWQPFQLEAVPLSRLRPIAFDCDAQPIEMSGLRLDSSRLPHASGWRLNGLRLRHFETGIAYSFDLPLDQTLSLPSGTYLLDSLDALVKTLLPKAPFKLIDGCIMTVPLETPRDQLLRVSVCGPNGHSTGPCRMDYGLVGQTPRTIYSNAPLEQALLLPHGTVEVLVDAFGYQPTRRVFTIPDDVRDGTLVVRLTYAR